MTTMGWYDSETVRHQIKPGEVFIVQQISIAGKVVELVGPLRLQAGDRIHLSLASDEQDSSTHDDEKAALDPGRDEGIS